MKQKIVKTKKIIFLKFYTFVYFKENVFPKYVLLFQTLRKFGNFCHFREVFLNFFCLMWQNGLLYWFFKELEPIYILLYTLEITFFLNLPEDFKYSRNLVIFSSLFFVIFFDFAVSLTNYTYMEYGKTLPDMIT